ncbi:MAG: hypothetical protein AAF415_02440 [Pseudomonadota bacterium]
MLLFHATFLGQALRREVTTYLDWPRFWRVTFRMLGITLVASLASVAMATPFLALDSNTLMQDSIVWLVDMISNLVPFLVVAWMGLRIPHMVARPTQRELPPRLQGSQPFRVALIQLICGPGLLLSIYDTLRFSLTPSDPSESPEVALNLQWAFDQFIATGLYIVSAAMTAAILSDTYLRFSGDDGDAQIAVDPS